MKPTEFFQWFYTCEITGKRRKTRHRMTREDAMVQYPDAEPDLLSLEVRDLPESPAEFEYASTLLTKNLR